MKTLVVLILILTSMLNFGCATANAPGLPNVPAPEQERTVEYKAAWDDKSDGPRWTSEVLNALESEGADMLSAKPKDEDKWCPGFSKFSQTQKKQFYVMLISEMARYESSFKPASTYKENFKNSKGEYVLSTGMLQISLESGKSYDCPIKKQSDLTSSKNNLTCGVMILNRWIGRDQHFGLYKSSPITKLGGARYWSVLRDSSKSQPKIKASLISYCKTL